MSSAESSSVTGDATMIKVCMKCNNKCETCSADDPTMCDTCNTDFYTNEYTWTDKDTGNTMTYTMCQGQCQLGKFAADNATKICDGDCIMKCAECDDGTTCNRCKNGFFLDKSDPSNHVCVANDMCPDSTYADRSSGECEPCSSNCATCGMKSDRCLTCDPSLKHFVAENQCVTSCPMGTYVNGTECMKCPNNLLNCDPMDGTPPEPDMAMECSPRCNGCYWTSTFCIGCAAGFKKASDGRCVEECPLSTYEVEMNNKSVCKSCSKGCLNCITEMDDQCPSEDDPSNPGNPNDTPMMEARCVRCDKDLEYYLFRGECVKKCPHGTFPDPITGWCAKCDCNCGKGGCVDRHTCKACPQKNMMVDKESGRCVCDTSYTAAWADDWKSFTITIDSPDVKFRDFHAEMVNGYDFMNKMCWIGNEGGMMMNMDTNSSVSSMDIEIDTCGNHSVRMEEIEFISKEFMGSRFENSSFSDDLGGEGRSSGGMGYGGMGSGGMMDMDGEMGEGMGDDFFGFDEDDFPYSSNDTNAPGGGDPSGDDQGMGHWPNDTETYTITDMSGECPAKADSYNIDELQELYISSPEDLYWYIQSLGTNFGNITDEELSMEETPMGGLEFTTDPLDLCMVLFGEYMYYKLDSPTCTVMRTTTQTMITVTVGEKAMIESHFHAKFQPNVFVSGCDWPLLDYVQVEDGAAPETLEVMLSGDRKAPKCEDYSTFVEAYGNIGEISCLVMLEGVYDSSEAEVTTQAVQDILMELNIENEYSAIYGEFFVPATVLSSLHDEGVETMEFEAQCLDSFGQHEFDTMMVGITSRAEKIEMIDETDYILYDKNFGEFIHFMFMYPDCANGGDEYLPYTVTLEKVDPSGNWVDATGADEAIMEDFIPPGLPSTGKYRLKLAVSNSDNSVSEDFYVGLEFIFYEPEIILDDFNAFLMPGESNEYTFTDEHFINVDDTSMATLFFDCTTCDNSECLDQGGALLDFNSFYTEANKSISIPQDTLAFEACYQIEVSVAYEGLVNSGFALILTPNNTATQLFPVNMNIREGEFRRHDEKGLITCDFDPSVQVTRSSITIDEFDLQDSDGISLVGNCATKTGRKIKYTKDCLEEDEFYFVICKLSGSSSGGSGLGQRMSYFSTVSNIDITTTISPSVGHKFTKFTITVDVAHEHGSSCSLAYKSPTTEGVVPRGEKHRVVANGQITLKDVKLPQVSTTAGNVVYGIECKSKFNDDSKFARLEVTLNNYSGNETVQKQEELSSFMNNFGSTNLGANSNTSSSQASQVVGSALDASEGFGSASESEAETVMELISEAISLLDFDEDEDLGSIMISTIIAISEVFDYGITEDAVNNLFDGLESMMVGKQTARRLQTSTNSSADDVRKLVPKGEERIKFLDETQCEGLSQSLSDISTGITNTKSMGPKAKEKAKRRLMMNFDRLTKACIHNLGEDEAFEMPAKNLYFFVYKQQSTDDSFSQDLIYEFDCPCSDSYAFQSEASSADADNGAVAEGTRMQSTQATEPSSEEKCFIKIPALSNLGSLTTGCTSVGVSVISSKDMCPGTEAPDESSTDPSEESFIAILEELLTDSEIEKEFATDENSCKASDFSSMQCTGPSLDVSYYCVKDSKADSSKKRLVERLTVNKFENDAKIEFQMPCSGTDNLTNGEVLQTIFLDESSGQNSCTGCDVTDGSNSSLSSCGHLTSFGYGKSVKKGGSSKDLSKRVFENFVFYLMLAIDGYLLAAVVFSLLKNDNEKQEIQVHDNSKAMEEYNVKNANKVENASNFDGEVRNSRDDGSSQGNEEEFYKAGFCKKLKVGFFLKYRLLTPFTTAHSELSRLSRGIINVLVLYFLWVFSGIVVEIVEKKGGSYVTAIIVCFIIARLATYALELLFKKNDNKMMQIITLVSAI